MSRSVVQTDNRNNDLIDYGLEAESDKEVSEYVDQIERNLDLELRAEEEISILMIM